MKLELATFKANRKLDAIYFNVENPDAIIGLAEVMIVYQLDVNTYLGRSSAQLMVKHVI